MLSRVGAAGSPRWAYAVSPSIPEGRITSDVLKVRSLHPDRPAGVPPLIDAGAAPRGEVVPDGLTFQVPAHRGLVACVGSLFEATIGLIDRDVAVGTYLEAAVVMLAEAIIPHARPWTPLEISITVDDTDAYVRLSAQLLDPDEPPQFGDHLRATLRRNVASHELVQEPGRVLAVLQVPLEPSTSA